MGPTSSRLQTPPSVHAYGERRAEHVLLARVVCEAATPEQSIWTDVVIPRTDETGRRLCDAMFDRIHCEADRHRIARACSEKTLGPAPEVPSNSTLSERTDAVSGDSDEQDAGAQTIAGQVHVYRVLASSRACADHHEAELREANERARSWLNAQVEHLENELRAAQADLEDLERRNGGPVGEKIAKLKAALDRERRPAERQRISRELLNANLPELEEAHIRRRISLHEKLITLARERIAYPTPVTSFTCFPPGGRQPPPNPAQ